MRQYLHTDENYSTLAQLLLRLWGPREAASRAAMMAHRAEGGLRLAEAVRYQDNTFVPTS